MRVIYVDTLFLLNLVVDYFLLLLTARIAGVYAKRRQLLLGALVGASMAVLLYFPPMPAWLAWLLRLVTCCTTVMAAFSRETLRHWSRLCGVFALMTLVLAGVLLGVTQVTGVYLLQNGVLYAEISSSVMLISFTVVYLISGLVLGKGRAEVSRSYREILVRMGGHQLQFRALVDSGNLLRDPLSGRRVIVLPTSEAAALFEEKGAHLLQNMQYFGADGQLSDLRQSCGTAFWLLPIHTATEDGVLLVFRPEELWIDGVCRSDYLLGLTPKMLEIGGDCRALMGV